MKNKSIIIMTILSLVLVVGCCYHQQYMMNCNYDMPVNECPAMVTNTAQDEVANYKDKDECYSDGIYISGMDIKNEICLGGYLVT